MGEIFSRNELYWGKDSQTKLSSCHVAVFGLGGVGGYCAEMLARAGVGELTIVDFDEVSESNINRQIIALKTTIGQKKTGLFEKRLKDINPEIKIHAIDDYYRADLDIFSSKSAPDFIADAIDTMRSKIDLLCYACVNDIPVISSMGAGNRVNPEDLYICDISDIEDKKAPFVSNVIYQLKKRDIVDGITVVASREKPFCRERINVKEEVLLNSGEVLEYSKITPASTPFVASVAGIYMASWIVREILN